MENGRVTYYPGCTLREKAASFEWTTRAVLEALEVAVAEMPTWYCCGAAFPLTADNLMKLLAPARNLAQAARLNAPMITGCAVCYHVLKRTQYLLSSDREKREKIEDFLEEKFVPVELMHLLGFLRDRVGAGKIKRKVKLSLGGVKLGCYYGCLLLRPAKEMDLDDPENPSVFEDLMGACGAQVVDFPHPVECCGSYLTVNSPETVLRLTRRILHSLTARGAEAVVTSCPLCYFNLDQRQERLKQGDPDFKPMPVFYVTELLAMALGGNDIRACFPYHRIDPEPLLSEKGLIKEGGVNAQD